MDKITIGYCKDRKHKEIVDGKNTCTCKSIKEDTDWSSDKQIYESNNLTYTNNILARLAKVEAGFVAHDDRIENHDDRIEKLEKQYENIKKLLEKKELVATLKTGSSRRR